MTKYYRVCKFLQDKGTMVPEDEIVNFINDFEREWYTSIFYFNESQLADFKVKGTVAGMTGMRTNKLFFDFDDKEHIENAKDDALVLVKKLLDNGLKRDEFNICFSSNKGFSVEIYLTSDYTAKEIKVIAKELAGELKSWDSVVYNENRIFRHPYTKNLKSGLHKIPISVETLEASSVDQIRTLARNLSNGIEYYPTKVNLPNALTIHIPKVEEELIEIADEFERKMKFIPACKEAILQGFFKPGKRNNALMALAAGLKGAGLHKEANYRLLKAAAEAQAKRYNQDPYAKEEIWTKIVEVVYGPSWNGATYSCRDHPFLEEICKQTGPHQCRLKETTSLVTINSVASTFEKYAKDIDKNTIKTGIDVIDRQIMLQTCSHVVLAGCSGSGKTTLILNILNKLSKNNLHGIFGSMDMNSNLIYQKLAHKVSGLNDKKLYALYQENNREEILKINTQINEEYKNILFDFRSGQSIEDLRTNILRSKDHHGDKLKVVVLDFINRIRGPYSDETSNLAYIAPRLSDLANESETMILSLAQTARHKGGPDTPLTDSRVSKGSSAIEESATVLFGIWRPGYNQGADDKYMCISALKTRMGREFTESLHFNGLTGEIRGLTGDEQTQFEHYVESKKDTKEAEDRNGW